MCRQDQALLILPAPHNAWRREKRDFSSDEKHALIFGIDKSLPSALSQDKVEIVLLVDHLERGAGVSGRPVLRGFSPADLPLDFKAG